MRNLAGFPFLAFYSFTASWLLEQDGTVADAA
jgi:hypothetical protein